MLSPHEIATLLVISRTNDARGVHPADLDTLIERNLVSKRRVKPDSHVDSQADSQAKAMPDDRYQVYVTPGGASLVDALSGYRRDGSGSA